MDSMKLKREVSKAYDRIFSTHGLHADRLYYKWIVSLLGDVTSKTVLDIACGEGMFLQEANKRHAKTFGIDVSYQALLIARRNNPQTYFVLSDGEDVCFNFKFDYVTCLGSLEHFGSPEKGCAEIIRLLKDNGKAVIVLPNEFSMHILLDVLCTGKSQEEGFQIIERVASFGYWKEFLEKNGLSVIKSYKVNERPVLIQKGKMRSIRKFLRNIWFCYMAPFYFARTFAFLCKKKEVNVT